MTVTCFVQVFHGLQQLGIVVALVLAVYVRRLNRDLHEEVLALRRRQAEQEAEQELGEELGDEGLGATVPTVADSKGAD